jgi:hypothetical protein
MITLLIDFDETGRIIAERTEALQLPVIPGPGPEELEPADPWNQTAVTVVANWGHLVVSSRHTEEVNDARSPDRPAGAWRRAVALLAHGLAARRLAVARRA